MIFDIANRAFNLVLVLLRGIYNAAIGVYHVEVCVLAMAGALLFLVYMAVFPESTDFLFIMPFGCFHYD